jgi:hypothetical protein
VVDPGEEGARRVGRTVGSPMYRVGLRMYIATLQSDLQRKALCRPETGSFPALIFESPPAMPPALNVSSKLESHDTAQLPETQGLSSQTILPCALALLGTQG